jgi:hypothetical protein
MKLLQLFEQLNRLDEAAVDRYMQMFEGIFNVLDAIDQTVITPEELAGRIKQEMLAEYQKTGQTEPYVIQMINDYTVENIIAQMKEDENPSPQMAEYKRLMNVAMRHRESGNPGASLKSQIIEEVKWTMEVLQRADRIIWYLRWFKIAVMSDIVNSSKYQSTPEIYDKVQKALAKDVDKMLKIVGNYYPQLEADKAKMQERIQMLIGRGMQYDPETGTQVPSGVASPGDSIEAMTLQSRINAIEEIQKVPQLDASSVSGAAGLVTGKNRGGQRSPNLQHIMQMAEVIPTIGEIKWELQTPQGMGIVMAALEDEWRESQDRFISQDEAEESAPDHEVLIEFPDGTQWWNLNKRACEVEGRSGGQCGNVNWGRDSDLILSLRQPKKNPATGDIGWIVRATFILDTNDNQIGEMKGYNNKKPSPKYHKYIVELLKLDIVEGVKGGGHAPEENFDLQDLNDEVRDKLLADKPELSDFITQYWNEGTITNDIFEKINELLDDWRNLSYLESHNDSELIVESDLGIEEVFNKHNDGYNGGYDDGSWWDPNNDQINAFIEGVDDDTVEHIRKHMVNDYIRRENATDIDPEIIDEIKDADAEKLFEMLQEYDDEIYDAVVDALKESFQAMMEGEHESVLDNYEGYGAEGAEGHFESYTLTGGGRRYRLVVEADQFMEFVAPVLKDGEDNYRGGSDWSSLLNINLGGDIGESASENLQYDEGDWFYADAVNRFEASDTMKQVISGVADKKTETGEDKQMEFDL